MSNPLSFLPKLKVTVFSDYICPFCYLGHHRLLKLRDTYDLKINWCFIEIHPEISSNGEPVSNLDYASEQWQQMLKNLNRIANEENISLEEIEFITNSNNALLLAEATKQCGRELFYTLHEALFHAYFVSKKNIGDKEQLVEIAKSCGIDKETIESAWTDSIYQQRLVENFNTARKYNIQSVPSFVFGKKVLTGVVTEANFREAAEQFLLENNKHKIDD